MARSLESYFPNLSSHTYRVTSPRTPEYNCVAFAAGDTERWWWPASFGYWPDGVPREVTLSAFVLAFGTLGYMTCESGELEAEFEKVAIYADDQQVPTHMARQLISGLWVSKCGRLEDIEHDQLQALESGDYGKVVQFLKRKR